MKTYGTAVFQTPRRRGRHSYTTPIATVHRSNSLTGRSPVSTNATNTIKENAVSIVQRQRSSKWRPMYLTRLFQSSRWRRRTAWQNKAFFIEPLEHDVRVHRGGFIAPELHVHIPVLEFEVWVQVDVVPQSSPFVSTCHSNGCVDQRVRFDLPYVSSPW